MKSLIFQGIAVLSLVILSVQTSSAETKYRGYTVGDYLATSDIEALGDTGANVARIWCRPSSISATEDRAAFFARVQSCLDKLNSQLPDYDTNGVQIIFALDPPGPVYASTSGTPQHSLFLNADHQSWFIDAWGQIASNYAGDSRILGFDLLNEPAAKKVQKGLLKWSALAQRLVATIRAAGATQNIYLEAQYGNPIKMSEIGSICKAAAKSGYHGLYGSFHFYSPFEYSHQGIPGRATGISPPNTKSQKKLAKTLAAAQKAQGSCSGVYVGEFGASAYAPDRRSYFQWLIGYFETRGWDWTCHAFREGSFWNTETDMDGGHTTDSLLRSYHGLNR